MNACQFMGNLTRDPDLRTTAGQKNVVNFGLAVHRTYSRGGELTKETAFIECEAWDTGGEMIFKHFKCGDAIVVECSVKQESWEDKETRESRSRLKFRVNKFHFVPRAKSE